MEREIKKCFVCGYETDNYKSFSNHIRYGCRTTIKYTTQKCRFCENFLPKRRPSYHSYFCNRQCYMKWKKGIRLGARKPRVYVSGYYYMMKPNHPRANNKGYVAEHVLIVEHQIGRLLMEHETVHHIDHNSVNNDINNLKLMSIHDHLSYHAKNKHYKSGGKRWKKGL